MAKPTLRLVRQPYSEAEAKVEIRQAMERRGIKPEWCEPLAMAKAIRLLVNTRNEEQSQ